MSGKGLHGEAAETAERNGLRFRAGSSASGVGGGSSSLLCLAQQQRPGAGGSCADGKPARGRPVGTGASGGGLRRRGCRGDSPQAVSGLLSTVHALARPDRYD